MQELFAMFPEEKANLDRFIATTNSLLKRFPLWALSKAFSLSIQKWIARTFLKDFFHFMSQTVEEAVPTFTRNKRLQVGSCYVKEMKRVDCMAALMFGLRGRWRFGLLMT